MILTIWYMYSGKELIFANWGTASPINYPNNVAHLCMKAVRNNNVYEWRDADCSQELPYICGSGKPLLIYRKKKGGQGLSSRGGKITRKTHAY